MCAQVTEGALSGAIQRPALLCQLATDGGPHVMFPEFSTKLPPWRSEKANRERKGKMVEAATLKNARKWPDLRKFRV